MNCKIELVENEGYKLHVVAANGNEHKLLNKIGSGNFVEVEIQSFVDMTKKEKEEQEKFVMNS